MRFTERDIKLVRDIALSHIVSRDQVIDLGYFDSVTRCNSRLRGLVAADAVRKVSTPLPRPVSLHRGAPRGRTLW